jgi:hypothetical protein
MNDRELYDEICKVLTWYEHLDECPLTEEELHEEMYKVLVKVQNKLCEEYDF